MKITTLKKVHKFMDDVEVYHCPKCAGVAYKKKHKKIIRCLEKNCGITFQILCK